MDTNLRGNARVRGYQRSTVETDANIVQHGSFNTHSHACKALMQRIQANGYRVCGPNREIYVKTDEPPRHDDPTYVPEGQLPVKKV